jgi:hypothetical protein
MRWQSVARVQGGVISVEQLAGAGTSRHAAARLASSGQLVRLARGVYLAGGAPYTFAARLWAAVLATGGLLGRTTAGRLWGVWEADEPLVHVVLPHRRRVVVPAGVVVHRQVIEPYEARHQSRLPVTSRRTTVLDLMATLRRGDAGRLADRAMQRGWIVAEDCARRLGEQPHRPGNAQLRRIASMLGDGAAAESERLLHHLLRRAGVTGWVPNLPVWADGELIGVVDVGLPDRRVAIEIDGMAYHVDVDRFRHDRRRQNALVALGWTVLRFTWADLVERPGYVIAAVRRLAA